jgi:hypothetical protein
MGLHTLLLRGYRYIEDGPAPRDGLVFYFPLWADLIGNIPNKTDVPVQAIVTIFVIAL